MSFTTWPKSAITSDDGEKVSAITPLIISASRSTDIPGFYGQWFMDRLKAGYVKWVNPWNGKPTYVSLAEARLFVFWSKNPGPFLPYLKELDKRGLHYYFHVTLNDYETEGLETGLPPLYKRIETFKQLADMIGGQRVLWRFDPLIITDTLSPVKLGERFNRIGRLLSGSTARCTISFMEGYKKTLANLARAGTRIRSWDIGSRAEIVKIIAAAGKEFGIPVVSCAGDDVMRSYGIDPGKCIDDDLIVKLFSTDDKLMDFLGVERGIVVYGARRGHKSLKDKGQRSSCRCIVSKDIGGYNTCGHQCLYCYANTSPQLAVENRMEKSAGSDSIVNLERRQ
jgi:hypothetical protein